MHEELSRCPSPQEHSESSATCPIHGTKCKAVCNPRDEELESL